MINFSDNSREDLDKVLQYLFEIRGNATAHFFRFDSSLADDLTDKIRLERDSKAYFDNFVLRYSRLVQRIYGGNPNEIYAIADEFFLEPKKLIDEKIPDEELRHRLAVFALLDDLALLLASDIKNDIRQMDESDHSDEAKDFYKRSVSVSMQVVRDFIKQIEKPHRYIGPKGQGLRIIDGGKPPSP